MKNRSSSGVGPLALAFAVLLCACPSGRAEESTIDSDLKEVSIAQLQDFYREGRYTALQVARWHLSRIERLEPKYNAMVEVYREEALDRASRLDTEAKSGRTRGPLWGVPVVVKGNTAIEGKIIGNGWQGYARSPGALVAARNATVVNRLLAAGAVILGQSNIPDFADSDTTTSSYSGRTGNAYNVWYSPGGSSGGAAVAVALNMAVIAQGTDTANSIRNPSSNGSLVGVLPTQGLVSTSGIHPYDRLLDNTGPIARTVTDAALALDAMAGVDPLDPRTTDGRVRRPAGSFTAFLKTDALRGRRLGVPHFILAGEDERVLSEETRAAFMGAVEQLRAAGAEIVFSDDILTEDVPRVVKAFRTSAYRLEGVTQFMGLYAPAPLHSPRQFRSQTAVGIPMKLLTKEEEQYELATDPLAETNYHAPKRALASIYQEALRKHRLDGFVYPALQVPSNDERVELPDDFPSDGPYSRTDWVNCIGVPAIVVPAGFYPDGLPFGIEISADYGRDGELLGYAYAYEQHARQRRPPPE